MSGGKYEGQGMMVGHRGEGEHGLLIIRQHGVEEQYSNVSLSFNFVASLAILKFNFIFPFQDGQDSMVVRQHNNQESHTDGIIVRHGQVKHTEDIKVVTEFIN